MEPGPGLPKPEGKRVTRDDISRLHREELDAGLRERGEAGWELVTSQLMPLGSVWVFVFKRPNRGVAAQTRRASRGYVTGSNVTPHTLHTVTISTRTRIGSARSMR